MDSQILQYKSKDPINSIPPANANNLTNKVKEQTTIPIKNHFSLLNTKQTVLQETTNDNFNNLLKTTNSHKSEHLATQNKDINMLDSNVAFTKVNKIDKNGAMQNDTQTDKTNPSNNYNPTILINTLKQKSSHNLKLTEGNEQNLLPRYGNIPPLAHVSQMATKENKSNQMSITLEDEKDAKALPIKLDIEQPKAMYLESSIITLSLNPSHSSSSINPMPATSLLNILPPPPPIKDAKTSINPKKKKPSNSNPSTTHTTNNGKPSTLTPTREPSDCLCPTSTSTGLPTCLVDGVRSNGTCNLFHNANQ